MANKTIIKAHSDTAGSAIGVEDLKVTNSLTVEGDFTVDTSALYVDSTNNNVGINILTPTSQAHVKSDGANDVNSGYLFEAAGNTDKLFRLYQESAAVDTRARMELFFGNSLTHVFDSGADSYINTGNFGIGTDSPSGTFHVQTSNVNSYSLFTEASANARMLMYNSASALNVKLDSQGDSYFNGGNVGVGTAAPATKLHVNLANSASPGDSNGLRMGTFQWRVQDTGGFNRLILDRNFGGWQADAIHIRADGNVGIGTGSPGSKLELADSSTCILTLNAGVGSSAVASIIWENNSNPEWELQHSPGTGRFDLYDYSDASIATYVAPGGTDWTSTSDARLKENIIDASSTLGIINNIQVRSYDWKDSGKSEIGFIAQELLNVVPNAVVGNPEDDVETAAMGITKAALIPYLVKAVQELSQSLDNAKAEIELLKNT